MTTGSDVILQRMMALHPKIIDLTLDRVWRLLEKGGNPQDRLPPVIHVAGTNGKGSTQAMIRAGLEGLEPGHLVLLRFLVAGALLLLYALLRGLPPPRREDLPRLFLLGFLGITVYHTALNLLSHENVFDSGGSLLSLLLLLSSLELIIVYAFIYCLLWS